ncbi:MAG TPA: tagatose 1,6-diphosphate aldolase [Planctomycetota bacterium]|nr:tagatose 1,6-diphosphate aldolase [Planctomycetota bacterium]HRR81015.1 tagatose 1,6-diphosphate aldolase [Planctomycetota bacterium]HRT93615.1 tagatose 1,6-diphosphate aldolase [Planctomycetota bacterium]
MPKRTALEISGMTPGKLLGLQRITNPNGTFTMLALDQNSSIIKMASESLRRQGQGRAPTYEEIVRAKLDLTQTLARKASAVLLDSNYGVWQAICAMKLPPRVGLVVRLEQTGHESTPDGVGRLQVIEPGWSVAKIKRLGANAVKLLVYYEPTHAESAARQRALVEQVARECDQHDIVFLLETLSYPLRGEEKSSPSYLDRKATTAIDTARHLSGLCDVYKAEFPGTLGRDSEAALAANLDALDRASARPWVLLSAGVDFADYERQVAMALAHGASGVLGGRAFWKEYFDADAPADRHRFLRTEGVRRLAAIDALVRKHGTPWLRRYGLSKGRFARVRIAEDWNRTYGAGEAAAAPAPPQEPRGDY